MGDVVAGVGSLLLVIGGVILAGLILFAVTLNVTERWRRRKARDTK